MKLANQRGYFIHNSDKVYVEFDNTGNLSLIRGWPNNEEISEAKKAIRKKKIEQYANCPYEMIYMLDNGKYIVLYNGSIRIIETYDTDQLILIAADDSRHYDDIYKNEIGKYLSETECVAPCEFWEKMALEHPGIMPEAAVNYIKSHVEEFRVEKVLIEG